jgi:hypothetical protein
MKKKKKIIPVITDNVIIPKKDIKSLINGRTIMKKGVEYSQVKFKEVDEDEQDDTNGDRNEGEPMPANIPTQPKQKLFRKAGKRIRYYVSKRL